MKGLLTNTTLWARLPRRWGEDPFTLWGRGSCPRRRQPEPAVERGPRAGPCLPTAGAVSVLHELPGEGPCNGRHGRQVRAACGGDSRVVQRQSSSAASPPWERAACSSPRRRRRSSPNNLVVFPDRDFLAVEGYQDRVGQTALIEVTRGGEVVGSAKATIAEGDPAIEVNHPGGACWGAGTDLNVTPDIRAGDKVSIRFPDEFVEDTIVQDAAVDTDTTIDEATRTVTVRATSPAGSTRTRRSSGSSTPISSISSASATCAPSVVRSCRRTRAATRPASTSRTAGSPRRTCSTRSRPRAPRPAAVASASCRGRPRTPTPTARA